MCAFHEPLRFVPRDAAATEMQPWGRHLWYSKPGLVETTGLLVVTVDMPPGTGHPFHRHPTREEMIYVLAGQAEQWVDRERRILGPADAAHIPVDMVHGIFNSGAEVCRFMAVLAPPIAEGPFLVDLCREEPWCSLRKPM
jgi:quercetin dioxygenase-like cupin family protein